MSFSDRFAFDILSNVGRHEIIVKDKNEGWWTTFAIVEYESGTDTDAATLLSHMLNGIGYNPNTGETDDHKL